MTYTKPCVSGRTPDVLVGQDFRLLSFKTPSPALGNGGEGFAGHEATLHGVGELSELIAIGDRGQVVE